MNFYKRQVMVVGSNGFECREGMEVVFSASMFELPNSAALFLPTDVIIPTWLDLVRIDIGPRTMELSSPLTLSHGVSMMFPLKSSHFMKHGEHLFVRAIAKQGMTYGGGIIANGWSPE